MSSHQLTQRLHDLEHENLTVHKELTALKNQCAILQRTYGLNGTRNLAASENAFLREENERLAQQVASLKLQIDWLLVLDKQRQQQQTEIEQLQAQLREVDASALHKTTTAQNAFSPQKRPMASYQSESTRRAAAPEDSAQTPSGKKEKPPKIELPAEEESLLDTITHSIENFVTSVSPRSIGQALAHSPMGRFTANLLEFDKEEEAKPDEPLVGIGICLERDNDTGIIRVQKIIENGASSGSGLRAGDVIRQVDDVRTNGEDFSAIVDAIRGPAGTTVKIHGSRQGQDFVLSIARGQTLGKAKEARERLEAAQREGPAKAERERQEAEKRAQEQQRHQEKERQEQEQRRREEEQQRHKHEMEERMKLKLDVKKHLIESEKARLEEKEAALHEKKKRLKEEMRKEKDEIFTFFRHQQALLQQQQPTSVPIQGRVIQSTAGLSATVAATPVGKIIYVPYQVSHAPSPQNSQRSLTLKYVDGRTTPRQETTSLEQYLPNSSAYIESNTPRHSLPSLTARDFHDRGVSLDQYLPSNLTASRKIGAPPSPSSSIRSLPDYVRGYERDGPTSGLDTISLVRSFHPKLSPRHGLGAPSSVPDGHTSSPHSSARSLLSARGFNGSSDSTRSLSSGLRPDVMFSLGRSMDSASRGYPVQDPLGYSSDSGSSSFQRPSLAPSPYSGPSSFRGLGQSFDSAIPPPLYSKGDSDRTDSVGPSFQSLRKAAEAPSSTTPIAKRLDMTGPTSQHSYPQPQGGPGGRSIDYASPDYNFIGSGNQNPTNPQYY